VIKRTPPAVEAPPLPMAAQPARGVAPAPAVEVRRPARDKDAEPARPAERRSEPRIEPAPQPGPGATGVSAEPLAPSRSLVIVQGPNVIPRGAAEQPGVEVRRPAAAVSPTTSTDDEPPPSTPLPPRVHPVRPTAEQQQPAPRTVEEVAGTARSKFELE